MEKYKCKACGAEIIEKTKRTLVTGSTVCLLCYRIIMGLEDGLETIILKGFILH